MLRPAAAGRLIVLLFATLTAAKEVVAGSLARNFNVLLVVLVAFVTTTVVFHGARRLQARRASRVVLSDRLREVVWLNISTVGAWGTIFYALQYIAPAIASALAVAALPLFTLALQRSIAAEDSIYRCDIVASIAIGLSICFLAWQSYNAPLIARTATGGAAFAVHRRLSGLRVGACGLEPDCPAALQRRLAAHRRHGAPLLPVGGDRRSPAVFP